MRKFLKIFIISMITLLIIASLMFFTVDYLRVKNDQLPIFCIKSKLQIGDGGTREYFGLGYKVIKYHIMIPGPKYFEEIHIGSWFMDYYDNIPDNLYNRQ